MWAFHRFTGAKWQNVNDDNRKVYLTNAYRVLLTRARDVHCKTRGDVEVKITAGNSVAFRGDCNHLIVLRVVSPEAAELVYDGLGAPAPRLAGKAGSNGQRRLAISKLRQLAANCVQVPELSSAIGPLIP
jgi:hypothetical protein